MKKLMKRTVRADSTMKAYYSGYSLVCGCSCNSTTQLGYCQTTA